MVLIRLVPLFGARAQVVDELLTDTRVTTHLGQHINDTVNDLLKGIALERTQFKRHV